MALILSSVSRECIYVALASLLPCSLRAHASTANLCYFQVVDHAADAERLFVRVSALPHRLDDMHSPRVFTLCLSIEQLAQALPWDRAMQARPTCDVRELVELHVQQMGGALPALAPVVAPASKKEQEEEDVTLTPLPEIFVSCETVAQVASDELVLSPLMSKSRIIAWARRTCLRAAMAVVTRQLSRVNQQLQSTLHAFLASLDTALRSVFVAQRYTHQRLVCAHPVYIENRHVGWHVLVGVPVEAARAA